MKRRDPYLSLVDLQHQLARHGWTDAHAELRGILHLILSRCRTDPQLALRILQVAVRHYAKSQDEASTHFFWSTSEAEAQVWEERCEEVELLVEVSCKAEDLFWSAA